MSANDRRRWLRPGLLAGLILLGACSGDDDSCARIGTFVLRNETSRALVVEAPRAVPDSVFTVEIDTSVVLGRFTGEGTDAYPDLRELMGCLVARSVEGDTLLYRNGFTATTSAWVLDESADCEGTFTLTLANDDLGSDDDSDSSCVDLETVTRLWSPPR